LIRAIKAVPGGTGPGSSENVKQRLELTRICLRKRGLPEMARMGTQKSGESRVNRGPDTYNSEEEEEKEFERGPV